MFKTTKRKSVFVEILKTLAATVGTIRTEPHSALSLRYVCNTALLITCCRSDWVDFGEVIIRMKLVFIGEESLNVFLF